MEAYCFGYGSIIAFRASAALNVLFNPWFYSEVVDGT